VTDPPPVSTDTSTRLHPPSVEHILALVRSGFEASEPEALTTLVRTVLAEERQRLAAGAPPVSDGELADAVVDRIEALGDPALTIPPRVINATGVILHTNLGRAPWPRAARSAALAAAAGYGYLELDPGSGRRGPRFRVAEEHLVALTGAEQALVVTNNAAALLLAVGLAGRRGSVVVSRGELVEIGGGVRIPEIIARAGARLIEVGTTNRTRAEDFEPPLAEGRARVVLRVHPSNFAMDGFTESADLAAVAALAHRHDALVVDDLGSGALLDTAAFGLAHEPTPSERLDAGADIVVFSGDKLVGGPQAGLIVGRRDLVERIRRDPLARAVRADKAILAGVAATLAIYRIGRAAIDIPVWQQVARTPASLRARAERIAGEAVSGGRVDVRPIEVRSPVGGGSLPGQTLPSWGVAVRVPSATRATAALRRGSVSDGAALTDRVLARILDDAIVFDLRTVTPFDDGTIARRIAGLPSRR
jgi:L-seryl-tRNA(Ser) seleniumtransferase